MRSHLRLAPEGIWAEIGKNGASCMTPIFSSYYPEITAATVVAAPEVGRGSLRSSAALSKLRGSIMATVLLLQQLTRVKKKKRKKFMSFSG